ncbi:MAG: hypothetical protein ACYSVY_19665 [Planctomycetota bacterium]|jgi:hypothetical protein
MAADNVLARVNAAGELVAKLAAESGYIAGQVRDIRGDTADYMTIPIVLRQYARDVRCLADGMEAAARAAEESLAEDEDAPA